MIRGTTAQFKFKLPYPKSELAWATIKFWQTNNPSSLLPINKQLSHCDAPEDEMKLCVSLTPDETRRFSEKYKAQVQMRAQHGPSGTIFGNRTALITVYPMRDDIIDEDPMLPAEDESGWIVLDGETIATP